MPLNLLIVPLIVQLIVPASQTPIPAAPETREAEAMARAFTEAFAAGDVAKFKDYFAETVRFAGDLRFLGAPQKEGEMQPSRDELATAYVRLIERLGRDTWASFMKQAVPSLLRAAKDGDHLHFAKQGDWVYSLTDPQRSGEDDVLRFVIRRIGDRLRIVGHWADY